MYRLTALTVVLALSLLSACSEQPTPTSSTDQPDHDHSSHTQDKAAEEPTGHEGHNHAEPEGGLHGLMESKINIGAKFIFNTAKAGVFDEEATAIFTKNAAELVTFSDLIEGEADAALWANADFQGWTADLKTAAQAIHTAASTAPLDPVALKKGIGMLGQSCSNCHNVYREEE